MTTPLARELKRAYPNSLVVASVEEKSQAAVRMNPYVDEVFLFKVQTFNEQLRKGIGTPAFRRGVRDLAARLKGYRFSTALVCQSTARTGLFAFFSGADRRIGYGENVEGIRYFLTDFLPFTLRPRPGLEPVEFLRYLGVENPDPSLFLQPPPEARHRAQALLQEHGIAPDRAVALCPATSQASKYWTEAGWAELSDALQQRYGFQPLYLGGPADSALATRINALARHPVPSFAGSCSLEESAAVIQRCAFTISVDTGLAFISRAVGRPLVLLHAVSPYTDKRMAEEPDTVVVTPPGACGSRYGFGRPRDLPSPDCTCMTRIRPEDVLSAVERLMTQVGV